MDAQCQLAQHSAAVEDAQKLQADASAALVSLGLRCEGLAETLAAERAARQVMLLPSAPGVVAALQLGLEDVQLQPLRGVSEGVW